MQTKIIIQGVKQFKGPIEGVEYDHCKCIVQLPFPRNRADTQLGFDGVAANYGKSENFKQFVGRQYPITVDADVEITTTGMDILHIEWPKAAPKV